MLKYKVLQQVLDSVRSELITPDIQITIPPKKTLFPFPNLATVILFKNQRRQDKL